MQLDIFCPSNENGIDIKTLMEKNKWTSSSTLKALTRCCVPAITGHLTFFITQDITHSLVLAGSRGWVGLSSGELSGFLVWIVCNTGDSCSLSLLSSFITEVFSCNVVGVCSASFPNTWICFLMKCRNGLYPRLQCIKFISHILLVMCDIKYMYLHCIKQRIHWFCHLF